MKFKGLFACILLGLLVVACKPTEKGYKAAYDAALGKRQAATADMDVNLPAGALQQVDGPQLQEIDGIKVYVLRQSLRAAQEDINLTATYNVAVGAFKMITNSEAQSKALREEGFMAFPAKTSDDLYYTIAGSFPTMSEAVRFYNKYRMGKNRVYVGLPDAPVIIFSPN